MSRNAVLCSVALVAFVLACQAATAAADTATTGVNCLVDPCQTPACKKKCSSKPYGPKFQCRANYTIGCDCDCLRCIPPKEICPVDGPLKCCGNNVCDFTIACVNNPLTKCGTICGPKDEAASYCKKAKSRCNPKKIQCCNGFDCRDSSRTKLKLYTCQKCKQYQESCTVGKSDCCAPYLECKAPGAIAIKGQKGKCDLARTWPTVGRI